MSHGSFYVTYLGHISLTYGSRHQHTLLLLGVLQLLCNLGYLVFGDHEVETWLMDTWYQKINASCCTLSLPSPMSDYEMDYTMTEYQETVYDGLEDEIEEGKPQAEDLSAKNKAGPS